MVTSGGRQDDIAGASNDNVYKVCPGHAHVAEVIPCEQDGSSNVGRR